MPTLTRSMAAAAAAAKPQEAVYPHSSYRNGSTFRIYDDPDLSLDEYQYQHYLNHHRSRLATGVIRGDKFLQVYPQMVTYNSMDDWVEDWLRSSNDGISLFRDSYNRYEDAEKIPVVLRYSTSDSAPAPQEPVQEPITYPKDSTFRLYDVADLPLDIYRCLCEHSHNHHRIASGVIRGDRFLQVYPRKFYYDSLDDWVADWVSYSHNGLSLFREGLDRYEDSEKIPIIRYHPSTY